jgi:hypothetical protein
MAEDNELNSAIEHFRKRLPFKGSNDLVIVAIYQEKGNKAVVLEFSNGQKMVMPKELIIMASK